MAQERGSQEDQQDYINTSGKTMMSSPFTVAELDTALATLQLKKSPHPDKIANEMLLHLDPAAKKKLLQLINASWRTGTVPQIWKHAIVVPVLKKGKDKTKADSYHPISLTSCMGKLTECLIHQTHVAP